MRFDRIFCSRASSLVDRSTRSASSRSIAFFCRAIISFVDAPILFEKPLLTGWLRRDMEFEVETPKIASSVREPRSFMYWSHSKSPKYIIVFWPFCKKNCGYIPFSPLISNNRLRRSLLHSKEPSTSSMLLIFLPFNIEIALSWSVRCFGVTENLEKRATSLASSSIFFEDFLRLSFLWKERRADLIWSEIRLRLARSPVPILPPVPPFRSGFFLLAGGFSGKYEEGEGLLLLLLLSELFMGQAFAKGDEPRLG